MKIEIRHRLVGTIPLLEVVDKKHLFDRLPLIIYYHGWQTSKELVLTQARKLAKEGFRVVVPDAENHGERKRPVSKIPSLTFWQSIQTNLFEFSTILDFFEQLKVVDTVGVGGVSMGGMTTTALLTQHPEIQAAACVMGSPSLLGYRRLLLTNIEKRGYTMPKDYEKLTSWIPAYDLETHYEKLDKRPLFFWHGTEDEKIPFALTKQFLSKNTGPEITAYVEKEKHMVQVETMDKVTAFFVDHLKKDFV